MDLETRKNLQPDNLEHMEPDKLEQLVTWQLGTIWNLANNVLNIVILAAQD
jgi:hypothetical protein